ncbi:MAG TPA: DUF3105 domain-containing protein [Candidatus Limnocylindria bacterium]|nr:DUF3105 domain-containing protein [Candidatus Limnocylindria bacterium]
MPRKKRKGERAAQRARSNYAWHRRVPWIAIGAAAVVIVVGVLIAQSFGVGESAGRYTGPGGGVGNHPREGQPIAYQSYPPTYGPHWPSATTWGFHNEPVPDERAVHNLEHGGVVASYNNIPAESLAALQRLLTTYPRDKYDQVKLVIRPYDRIPAGTIVLTAWNWIDELPAYDEARVTRFLNAHLNKCCEDVP